MSYFCRVLDAVDQALPFAGLTFLITWNVDAFDERFEGAVVLLIGDEKYQAPSFIRRVRAVFKTGGTHPNPLRRTLELPWAIAWRVILRDLRNQLITIRRGLGRDAGAPRFEIPLGTYHLIDTPFVPIDERPVDVFFAGTAPKLGRGSPRPSVAARLQLRDAIRAAEVALPTWRFEHTLTRTDRVSYDAAEYSRRMMNARIIPCPRGNFDETFRLLEAAKSGCVIITEPLPKRWYYRNAPVIQISGWSELPATLQALACDPERIRELAVQTRHWWDNCVSEQAIARYFVEQLETSIASGATTESQGHDRVC